MQASELLARADEVIRTMMGELGMVQALCRCPWEIADCLVVCREICEKRAG